jgi:hypothetical protein
MEGDCGKYTKKALGSVIGRRNKIDNEVEHRVTEQG